MSQPPSRFEPPFCPSRECEAHRDAARFRFKRAGWYRRENPPHWVQRFRCLTCGVFFSRQTYELTYWLKRPDLVVVVFRRLLGCSSFRQIGRDLGVHHATIARLSARLGRQALLLHESLRPRELPDEALVLDGFRSFEHSQYHPCDLNLIVGSESRFLHAVNEAELRRSGTMRPDQRARRARLERLHGRPDPRATENAVAELLAAVVPPGASVKLLSDEHRAYPRAMRRLPDRRFHHVTVSSRRPRTPDNPLDPVNDADRFIRHSQANHKRETLAFSKRRQSALERLWSLMAFKNYSKGVNEAKGTATPAQRLGLLRRRLSVEELLQQRLFPERVGLTPQLRRMYERRVSTRALPVERRHELKYAY